MPSTNSILQNQTVVLPTTSIYDIPLQSNADTSFTLEQFKGKKILLVNTASDCGYTAQYAELETLYKQYQNKLVIIAIPSNDFKNQEKANNADIAQFCSINYGVTFPILQKAVVLKENQQHPLYQWLTNDNLNGWCTQPPVWNFCKYLINEQGVLTHYFKQTVSPLSKEVIQAISK
ncbi:MAG: glutathione peroxidase [Chitinophagaceae bacterium]